MKLGQERVIAVLIVVLGPKVAAVHSKSILELSTSFVKRGFILSTHGMWKGGLSKFNPTNIENRYFVKKNYTSK